MREKPLTLRMIDRVQALLSIHYAGGGPTRIEIRLERIEDYLIRRFCRE